MKAKTAKHCVLAVVVATVALTFIQPTVIHQLVVWVSGLFAIVACLALFVIDNLGKAPVANQVKQPVSGGGDVETINAVITMRACGHKDQTIAAVTGIDIDVIRAIP